MAEAVKAAWIAADPQSHDATETLPPEITAVIDEGRRHPERRTPRPPCTPLVTEVIHECRVRLAEELLRKLRKAGWQPAGSAVDQVIGNWLLDHGANPDAE